MRFNVSRRHVLAPLLKRVPVPVPVCLRLRLRACLVPYEFRSNSFSCPFQKTFIYIINLNLQLQRICGGQHDFLATAIYIYTLGIGRPEPVKKTRPPPQRFQIFQILQTLIHTCVPYFDIFLFFWCQVMVTVQKGTQQSESQRGATQIVPVLSGCTLPCYRSTVVP